MTAARDDVAAAIREVLGNTEQDRRRGLVTTTEDWLAKAANAAVIAWEAYGVRRCGTCSYWERVGHTSRPSAGDYGVCGFADDWPEAGPLPFMWLSGEDPCLWTHEGHGCRQYVRRV